MTVPFIMALGVGVAAVRGGRAADDSFGFVGLASIGPVMAVLIMGMLFSGSGGQAADASASVTRTLLEHFLHLLPEVTREVVTALGPLVVLFILFQLFLLHMPPAGVGRMIRGLIYTFIGLICFFVGVKGGFMPAGTVLGGLLAAEFRCLLIPVGLLTGMVVVCAEPAVWVLTDQVEQVSGGHIRQAPDAGHPVAWRGGGRGHRHVPGEHRGQHLVVSHSRVRLGSFPDLVLPADVHGHRLRFRRRGFGAHGVHLYSGLYSGRVRGAGRQSHYRRFRRYRHDRHDAAYCHPGPWHSFSPQRTGRVEACRADAGKTGRERGRGGTVMSAVMQTIYAPAKLLVTIVDRGRGEAAMTVAKGAGARGGTILLGRGTADNRRCICWGWTMWERTCC